MSTPLSIIIVEDEEDLSYLFKLYLARFEIDSIIFANPLLALEHYEQNHGRLCSGTFRLGSTVYEWSGTC